MTHALHDIGPRGSASSRRHLLQAAATALAAGTLGLPTQALARPAGGPRRLATAWRAAAAAGTRPADHVGVLEVDWDGGVVRVAAATVVPERAHGLLALPGGGFVAVGFRPGRWLLRCDAAGQAVRWQHHADERPVRSYNGHVECSADGRWLYTTETDPADGSGWISVRDAGTLERVAQFASGGGDAHQLLRAPDGSLVVANGGIPRDAQGRAVDRARMDPSLVRIDPRSGRLLGQWRLPDARLSPRHMAWAAGNDAGHGMPLLGIGLQAEHDGAEQRRDAPALAVWDGATLALPCADAAAGGYVGDISAGPGGGFVLSAQKVGRGLWWHPAAPERLTLVAELTEPCALVWDADPRAVLIGAGRGLARWQVRDSGRMLRWPVAMAPDNHAVLLDAA